MKIEIGDIESNLSTYSCYLMVFSTHEGFHVSRERHPSFNLELKDDFGQSMMSASRQQNWTFAGIIS